MSEIKTTYNNLPLYEAVLGDDTDGIFCVSFVSEPATQTTWQLFAAQKKALFFNDDKMEVTGVLMVADTPIYRVDNETHAQFYIYYSADTLKRMVSKMLEDNTFNNIDIQHDGQCVKNAASMTGVYQVDGDNKPAAFSDIPSGSVICSYKIHDAELWAKMKSGELTGFSLAGYFTLTEAKNTNNFNFNNMKKKKINSIKALLSRLVLNFEETTLTDGTVWLHDGELTEGTSVTLEDGTPVPDGSYETDTLTITVTEGVVSSVSQKDGGEPETVEAEDEAPAADGAQLDYEAEIEALRVDVDALKADIEAIKALLAAKTDTPVVEEFSAAPAVAKRKMSNASRFIASL